MSFAGHDATDVTWLHLRLVVAPKELGLLPYEFSLPPPHLPGSGQKPFFVNSQRLTTLTREVRQNASTRFNWPAVPRVLFAWAAPGKAVPHEQHAEKLMVALSHWVAPFKDNPEPVRNVGPRFTELPRATLSAIRKAIADSAKNPYTHVHILAHGTEVPDRDGSRFALALHGEQSAEPTDAVDGWKLADALSTVVDGKSSLPAIVVVSACDGGNIGSPILPGAGLAHALHTSGVPYVLASQFPLTEKGSIDMVSELYPRLFTGEDPRAVLYYVRARLMSSHTDTHDWASLVAYARFPEDVDQQLEWVRLKLVLARLKVAHAWVDHALKFRQQVETTFTDVESRLDSAIDDLKRLLDQGVAGRNDPRVQNETMGLLGSAYKRKAEHLYRRAALNPEGANTALRTSREALVEAARWYCKAHDALLSDHWVGCQYLSLQAATKGTLIKDQDRWTVVRFAAMQALENSKGTEKLWPLGTLTELYLLQPLTLRPDAANEAGRLSALATAAEHLTRFETLATDAAAGDEIASTAHQLDRYVSWWPDAFPSAGAERLKVAARDLRAMLPPAEDL